MAIIKKKIEDLKPGKNYLITVRAKNSDLNVFSEAADSIKISIPKDPTIPEYPNNLELSASFEQVMFVFDPAPDIDISYYEYELYESSQVTGSFPNYTISGSPVVSGQSASNVFTVSVQNSSKNDAGDVTSVSYKGRVKSVDTSLNKSSWSPIVQTNQSTPLLGSQYIDTLTASKITSGTIGAHTITLNGANSIIKSSTFNGTAVGDGSYTGATQGWLINGTGKSYFYDATIVGSIDIGGFDSGSFHVDTSGNLWLGAGSYASAPFRISSAGNVDVGGADSTSFHIDNSGNIWSGAGAFNTSTNPFSVTSAGILRATNAIISGNITATSGSFTGTISGATITGSNISTGDIFIREQVSKSPVPPPPEDPYRYYLTYLLGDFLQTKRMTDSTYSAITGSGAFLGYYNTSAFADDAAMIVNSTTPYTSGTYVSAQSNGNIVATGTIYPGNIDIYSGSVSFGSSVRQMINLWSTSYGIGVQNNTQYFRSDQNFAWYTGGSHANGALDAGSGGTRRMYLSNGDLVVGSSITLGSHTLTSNAFRLVINPNNYTNLQVGIGEFYSYSGIYSSGGGLKIACASGGIFFRRDNDAALVSIDYNNGNLYSYGALGMSHRGTSASADYIVIDTSNGYLYIKSSNRDLKNNIEPISDSITLINKLNPVSFNWNTDESDSELQIKTKAEYRSMGFILEDVLDVSPELVTWRQNDDGDIYPGYWKTDDFIALAIQGIKDLKSEIDSLRKELESLK